MKKEWMTPELIVLVRGRPEERVLDACKDGSASGPAYHFLPCQSYINQQTQYQCGTCDTQGSS